MVVEGHAERDALSLLERIRGAELAYVLPMLPERARVLELGGGNGFQAKLLTEAGHGVVSIDIANHPNYPHQFYPVETYNGLEIPYPDGSFDVVFSSNVLEHVPHLDALCRGMRRVLAPGGIGVHLMPSPTWRMASLLAHYPYLAKYAFGYRHVACAPNLTTAGDVLRRRGLTHLIKRALWPGPHGEFSSAVAELMAFRRRAWVRRFEAAGFTVTHIEPAGLFYTGYCLCNGMSVRRRQQLARIFGSACTIFIVRPRNLP